VKNLSGEVVNGKRPSRRKSDFARKRSPEEDLPSIIKGPPSQKEMS